MKVDTTKVNESVITELCKMMTRNGSDKGNGHTYTRFYYEMFKDIRNEPLNIFEVGLGTNNINIPSNMGRGGIPGASLRGWRDFFPNANIVGADIDKDILFTENRIKTFYCNQLESSTIIEMWSKIPEYFDIIVDDGLHTPQANLTFFQNSFFKLKQNGIYIIEDIYVANIPEYEKFLTENNHLYQVVLLNAHNDNNFVIVWK